MSSKNYDAIVIGAGHNGLVAANYLAKAGRKVLVLERRDIAGGQLVTESFGDGFVADSLHASGRLRPDIVRDLGLSGPAFDAEAESPRYVSLLGDGTTLELPTRASAVRDASGALNVDSIRRHSASDAARWPEFVTFMDRAAAFLDAAYRTPMPRLPNLSFGEGVPLAKLLWKLRRLGGTDMFRVVRAMSMSVEELTDNWFESEPVRAAISALAIHGVTLGAMSAGTGYTLMHNWLNRGGLAHRAVPGGVGRISEALVAALKQRGGDVRTAAHVQQIIVEKQHLDVFTAPKLAHVIERLNADAFVVYGVVTEICVLFAARGLLKHGKPLTIVTDAIASLSAEAADLALVEIRAAGGRLALTSEITRL